MRSSFAPRSPHIAALVSTLLVTIPSYSQAPAATITGIVRSTADHRPLRKVMVQLFTPDGGGQDAAEITDGEGRFRFTGLPAGRYRLSCFKDGYLQGKYGAKSWEENTPLFSLTAGEQKDVGEWEIIPAATISGTIRTLDGDPAVGALVTLGTIVTNRGKRSLARLRGASTSERGEFRIGDVMPGKYVISVTIQNRIPHSTTSQVRLYDPPPPAQTYPLQFYPGTDDPEKAAPIVVRLGEQIRGIDLSLTPRPLHQVSAQVLLPGGLGASATPPNVRISLTNTDRLTPGVNQMGGHWIDRPIPVAQVGPGHYRLRADMEVDGIKYAGVAEVEVGEAPPPPVSVSLEPALTLSGLVVVEGDEAKQFRRFEVSLVDRDEISGLVRTSTDQDFRFSLSGMAPGVWDIGVNPIPPGGYIKAMLLGDQDVLTKEMLLDSRSKGLLKIILSTRGATLEGVVKNPQGDPEQAMVLAFPEKYPEEQTLWRTTGTNILGEYRLEALPPGPFKIVCISSARRFSPQSQELIAKYISLAEPVQIREGAKQKLDLRCPDSAATGTGAKP